jgi:hypothetical protein
VPIHIEHKKNTKEVLQQQKETVDEVAKQLPASCGSPYGVLVTLVIKHGSVTFGQIPNVKHTE